MKSKVHVMRNEELLTSLLHLEEYEKKQIAMLLIASLLNSLPGQEVTELFSNWYD